MVKKRNFKTVPSGKADANPFNIKINRKKHSVLGEKIKGTRGRPGVSHALNYAKRKDFMSKQREQNQKANCFVDKRLMDSSMPEDERATFRLVKERQKRLKKSIFNLNEEDLTHKGMPLHAIESFKDDGSDSEDGKQLDANFVKEVHFGGFISDSKTEMPKSRKEIIDELIVESKKKKQERKFEKEMNIDLTEKLDQEWKQLHCLMPGIKSENQQMVHEKKDSYDVIMQELKFELRGAPTSRLKTPEEIAREEEEKLRKVEKARESRMIDHMDFQNSNENGQLSADSIYDGLDLELSPAVENEDEYSHENKSDNEECSDSDVSLYSSAEIESVKELNTSNKKSISSCEEHSKIPENMEDFIVLMNSCTLKEFPGLLDSLINDNLPCKSEKKLSKLETLFGVLIEYLLACCENPCKNIEISAELFPHLYKLVGASPLQTAYKFLSFLDQEQQLFEKSKERPMKKHFPRLQALLLLKLCSVLYSVSDFRHSVVTPALLFLCDILSSSYHISFENLVSRLFASRLVIYCILDSKRLVPEALTFLNNTLHLALNKEGKKNFSLAKGKKFNLVLSTTLPLNEVETLNLWQSDCNVSIDSKKLSILCELINQLCKFATLYGDVLSYAEIFSHTLSICSALPCEKYPKYLQDTVCKLAQIIKQKSIHPLKSLTFINPKPKPLKLFEPLFDSKYTIKKDDIAKKRKLIKQVSQKIKKEEKGILREMRRDMQVVAGVKLSEKLEADEERKRKVKKLYQELAMQEGEFKKFSKKL